MPEPVWDDPRLDAGTMVRGALWLLQVVGVGNVFTKEDIRRAFPGVAQADRRIRDLRTYGWRIETNSSDATLTSGEQRLSAVGVHVWIPEARANAELGASASIPSKVRAAILAADNFQCAQCGIAGGELYVDPPTQSAVLVVCRSVPRQDELGGWNYLTLCRRCKDGDPELATDPADAQRAITDLSDDERDVLLRWLGRGRRARTALDRAWIAIRRLPRDIREDFIRDLRVEEVPPDN